MGPPHAPRQARGVRCESISFPVPSSGQWAVLGLALSPQEFKAFTGSVAHFPVLGDKGPAQPLMRLVYLSRQREADEERGFNWCFIRCSRLCLEYCPGRGNHRKGSHPVTLPQVQRRAVRLPPWGLQLACASQSPSHLLGAPQASGRPQGLFFCQAPFLQVRLRLLGPPSQLDPWLLLLPLPCTQVTLPMAGEDPRPEAGEAAWSGPSTPGRWGRGQRSGLECCVGTQVAGGTHTHERKRLSWGGEMEMCFLKGGSNT